MVQRKVANKLGIQADHAKSNKQLDSLTKPSSPLPRGADLKMKMKKSGSSTKRPVAESLPTARKERTSLEVQPGKPPTTTLDVARAASPQKQSPNYMKSTSSFEARKERSSPVSSRISQTSIENKTPRTKKNEKTGNTAVSGHRSSRTLARTSSLELVRTLTKTPSFKPSRGLKKCSRVVICDDLDVQNATCSSTLKDSKFPNFLELNPGGTELEGTSVMRVCPYTYCSLNGHHHAPSPPLKCFLSARRRMLKTQKNIKMGCLSPGVIKPSGDGNKEIEAETLAVQEDCRDFFIEIYSGIGEAIANKSPEPEISSDESSTEKSQEVEESSSSLDERYSEAVSEMQWEAGEFSEFCVDAVPSVNTDEKTKDDTQEENSFKLGDKEIIHLEVLNGLFDEESLSTEEWLEDGDSDHDEPTTEGKGGSIESDDTTGAETTLYPAEDDIEGQKETRDSDVISMEMELTDLFWVDQESDVAEEVYHPAEVNNEIQLEDFQLEDNENKCTNEGYGTTQCDLTSEMPGNQESDSSVKYTEQGEYEMDQNNTASQLDFPADQLTDGIDEVSATNNTAEIEKMENVAAKLLIRTEPYDDTEAPCSDENEIPAFAEGGEKMKPAIVDEEILAKTQEDTSGKQSKGIQAVGNHDFFLSSTSSEDVKHLDVVELQATENGVQTADYGEEECGGNLDEEEETCFPNTNASVAEANNKLLRVSSSSVKGLPETCQKLQLIIGSKRTTEESDNLREFNPRDPNYLPVEPDPDAEKVDLRHQMMDERKNAEEWMVDFALRRAVNGLAPARKKKVELLVEAFEKVLPLPKYESHLRRTSGVFAHARTMQACS